MSAASEALADVRGWLCDNLSEGDAGKVCGMLSVVSRHITEIEDENANLMKTVDTLMPSLIEDNTSLNAENARLRSYLSNADENARQIMAENAKLRELLADTLIDPRDYCANYGIDYDGWDSANDDIDRRLRELGVTDD